MNRYGVERIEADLMLGFFFPGAAIVSAPGTSDAPATSPGAQAARVDAQAASTVRDATPTLGGVA